mgnify:CR=1 FL=1
MMPTPKTAYPSSRLSGMFITRVIEEIILTYELIFIYELKLAPILFAV